MRPADYKLAGGVDVIFYLALKELLYVVVKLGFDPGNEDVNNIVLYRFKHFLLIPVEFVMLG